MTASEVKQVKMAWLKLAAYYQMQIQDYVFDMYVRDVAACGAEQILAAMTRWRENPKNYRPPLPAQIKALIAPDIDDEVTAREVAARIIGGVRRVGPMTGDRQTKVVVEYLGPLCLEVVRRLGGWNLLCESLRDDEITAYTAQIRDLTKSVLVLARAGQLDRTPELPSPITHGDGKRLGDLAIGTLENLSPQKFGIER